MYACKYMYVHLYTITICLNHFIGIEQGEVKKNGPSAMELKMPYDEQKFLTTHIGFVTRGLGFKKTSIYDSEDPNAPDPSNLKANAMPNVPVFCFYHDESIAKEVTPPAAPVEGSE